jgi:hypothetical protein
VIDGGTSEIAVFEPWTAHTATVENNRILSNGEPGKYAINFKAQNWWPIVRGNTFADYTDKGIFAKQQMMKALQRINILVIAV